MQFVTLVNRSSKTLRGTWDGKHFDITPGKHSFPEIQAIKFKEQNPIMGSEDPRTLMKQYLIGIEELGDDCTPVEQSDAITLEDLSKKIQSGELRVVKGNGLYNPNRDGAPPLPNESSFVKP